MASSSPEVYVEEHNVIIAPGGIATKAWPVYWSAIWVGALSALAVALVFGFIGTAIGAHQTGKKIVNVHDLTFWGLVFSVAGAFFSFVVGGWVASSIAGLRRAIRDGRGERRTGESRCRERDAGPRCSCGAGRC